jgi:prepilin-type N-terminal cleavage/methylation domain-containing protein
MRAFRESVGFTQVELIVAIVIIAIAAAFALPNVLEWRANAKLNGAARDLVGHFQIARMEAAKRSGFCTITFSIAVDGTPYDAIVYVDSNRNLQWDNEEILRRVKFSDSIYKTISLDTSQGGGDGLTFADNGIGQPSIAFNPSGLPVDDTGNIITAGADSVFIRNDRGGTKSITVSPAGNIRIN